jgi:hypothetical protein
VGVVWREGLPDVAAVVLGRAAGELDRVLVEDVVEVFKDVVVVQGDHRVGDHPVRWKYRRACSMALRPAATPARGGGVVEHVVDEGEAGAQLAVGRLRRDGQEADRRMWRKPRL